MRNVSPAPTEIPIDPITLAAIFAGVDNLVDFLFGSGHAGSCGAFRDLYFETIDKIQPKVDYYRQIFEEHRNDPYFDFRPIITEALGFVISLLKQVDDLFDRYKGRNLLGTVMFVSRLSEYLHRELVLYVIYTITYWLRAGIGQLNFDIQEAWKKILKHDQDLKDVNQGLKDLSKKVDDIDKYVNSNIPALWKSLGNLVKDVNKRFEKLGKDLKDLDEREATNTLNGIKLIHATLVATWGSIEFILDKISFDQLKDLYDRLKSIFKEIPDQMLLIAAAAQNLVNAIQDLVKSGDQKVIDKVKQMIKDAIDQALKPIKDQLDKLDKAQGELKKALQDLDTWTHDQVKDIRKTLQDELPPLKKRVSDLEKALEREIKDRIKCCQDLDKKIDDTADKLKKAADECCQEAYDKAMESYTQTAPILFQFSNAYRSLARTDHPAEGIRDVSKRYQITKDVDLVLAALEHFDKAAIPGPADIETV